VNEVDSAQREARAREVRHAVVASLTASTHRTFRVLFAVQWPVALLLAWYSAQPGEPRVLITLVLGAMLGVPPLLFARAAPQAWWVRQVMALAQVSWSMLFMWLLEGRSEAQFHLFVSLVFLVFYRDWSVLITATAAAVTYPVLRIALLPEAYVVGPSAVWRVFDQSIWVVCEALILSLAVRNSLKTIEKFSMINATLALENEKNARAERERHEELLHSREQYRLIAEANVERDSAQDQKLESVGRIAAGVAHEINTSVQFISDSVRFVRHALRDVPHAIADYRALAAGVLSGKDVTEAAKKAHETDEAADVDYFIKNAPDALDRALEGIGRVGSVVKAMTEFAHPDQVKTDVDVNRAVRNTLNMARNEYKEVAELETDFGDVPSIRCHAGDVNQVVLNLVLNAAHAISDVVGGTSQRGRITVRTRAIGDYVEISVSDTGAGIPESVRARIFEPFVTTKEVGRGMGQGLSLSRGIVVEKLQGSLHFETETGQGTTFFVRLPIPAVAMPESTTKQAAA
jgi:signal transduction histidine kinase